MTVTDPIQQMPIRNQEDLQRAVSLVKQRIRKREEDLEERWEQLPEAAAQTMIEAAVPMFLGNRLASVALRMGKKVVYKLLDKFLGPSSTPSF